MELSDQRILGAIEALLFVYGEPLEVKKIAKLIGIEESRVKEALTVLDEGFNREESGLRLIFSGDKVQLATKPYFSDLLENFVKEDFDENLTPAALETLSIISFLGPISRPKVDYYRGVNSTYTIRNLLMRGLVEKYSDSNNPNTILYRVSFDLLKHLGVSKTEDLPDYQKYQSLISESK